MCNEVTDIQFCLKFSGKFEFIGAQKGHFSLFFRCRLLKGTENFLPAPGFEPRLLDYQSSVLTIILQIALYITTIYIFILYYFDVGMIIGLMLHPLRSLSLLLARRRDRSWFVRTAECLDGRALRGGSRL